MRAARSPASVTLLALTLLLLSACAGGGPAVSAPVAPDMPLKLADGSGGGWHFADVHQQHEALSCWDCHRMHGGLMPDRARYLTCHEEQVDHHRNWECRKCHNSRGNRGSGASPQ